MGGADTEGEADEVEGCGTNSRNRRGRGWGEDRKKETRKTYRSRFYRFCCTGCPPKALAFLIQDAAQ